jgi:spore maturation protein CgeB
MEILKRSAHGYEQDPTKNLGFEKYDGQGNPDVVLIIAAFDQHAGCWKQFDLSDDEIDKVKKKKVVRLEFEEPNKFFIGEDFDSYDHEFYKVFTLCPYSAEYLNARQAHQRRVPIYFPFDSRHIPPVTEKKYDIIYSGHLHPAPVLRDVEIMSRFKYRLVSNSEHALVTDRGVGYEQKITLISESRITLVHNLLYPTFRHLTNVWKYPQWRSNHAFSELPAPLQIGRFFTNRAMMVVPQLKSRAFEAAFSRSLILCKKDPFNVIERYFEPGKEFVYFEEGHLAEAISGILRSYDQYQSIVDSAFERAQGEYTTEAFFRKYLRDIV